MQAFENYSLLLPLAVLFPAIGAALVALTGGRREKWRNIITIVSGLFTLVITGAIASLVFDGAPLFFEIPFFRILPQFPVRLDVDIFGASFAVLTALVWLAALIHGTGFMSHEKKQTRFFTFMLLTEAATLGIFLVRDFFSLFLFFEISGLAAYILVVHTETAAARAAGKKYIFMTIIGGLSLLMGIFLYLSITGTISFIPMMTGTSVDVVLKTAAIILMIGGFGVKAGIVPLHVWLPDAHPAAPSPASAILSGIMIKAGAYGILRVIAAFFYSPYGEAATNVGRAFDLQTVGLFIIAVAAATMFSGMVLAVLQNDIKRTLAYSSVSQMGFIIMGIGCLTYLGEKGTIGLAGSLYHILNHALFKACLFLIAGAVLFRCHDLKMYPSGGLYRKMPVTTILWGIAVLGIMGIPFFNGFASKTLLHEAIIEAAYLAATINPSHVFWLTLAEILFVISAAGTVLFFLKITYYVFFHRVPPGNRQFEEPVKEAPTSLLIGAGILATGVILIGLFPNFILKRILVPGVFSMKRLDEITVEHLGTFTFFTWYNVKNIIIPLAIGVAAFVIALYLRLFEKNSRIPVITHFKVPVWFSFDYWYVALARGLETVLTRETDFSFPESAKNWVISVSQRLFQTPKALEEMDGDIATGTLVVAAGIALLLLTKFMLGIG